MQDQNSSVTRLEREQFSGHPGVVVWLTGLSGAGKSTSSLLFEATGSSRINGSALKMPRAGVLLKTTSSDSLYERPAQPHASIDASVIPTSSAVDLVLNLLPH